MYHNHRLTVVQAWSVAHPPIRGLSWLLKRPRCHAGFLRAWLANDFNKIVVDRVIQILQARGNSYKSCAEFPRLLITGAAADIAGAQSLP